MKTALTTLCIGDHAINWERFLEASWRQYVKKHGYDLVVFDRPFDASPEAAGRKLAWQKMLLLEQPALAAYDRVVWVDCDIFINHLIAPPIDAGIDPDKIAICEETPYPGDPVLATGRARARAFIDASLAKTFGDAKGGDLYALNGFPGFRGPLLNNGVFVCGRREHAALMRSVYEKYRDRGRTGAAFEMVPFSYELVTQGRYQLLDPRFNVIYAKFMLTMLNLPVEDPLVNGQIAFVAGAVANSYFLHFAGRHTEIRFCRFLSLENGRVELDPETIAERLHDKTLLNFPKPAAGQPGPRGVSPRPRRS